MSCSASYENLRQVTDDPGKYNFDLSVQNSATPIVDDLESFLVDVVARESVSVSVDHVVLLTDQPAF